MFAISKFLICGPVFSLKNLFLKKIITMKKIYLPLILALLSFSLFAQVAFAPAGAEWHYRSTSGYTGPAESFDGFERLAYIGDTMLDGRQLKLISSRLFMQSATGNYRETLHYLFQRSDSLFEYYPETRQMRLLFRNNYAPGDIVSDLWGQKLWVQSIEVLNLNGRQLRRFVLADSFSVKSAGIYDLFGPESGLFSYDLGERLADIGTVQLRCYSDAVFPRVQLRNESCDAVL